MSGSRSLGDNETWQVICLAGIGVMYLYTMARWLVRSAEEVVEGWREQGAYSAGWNAIGTQGRRNQTGTNNI